MTRLAPSGVPGLTPRQVRLATVGNDWGALPILRHDASAKGAGKAPVLAGWEEFAAYDADLPTVTDLDEWDARFPFAPGTGFPMGNQVAFDLDFLRNPTLVKAEAIPLGERLIALEAELERLFAGRTVTPASLATTTDAIGATQAALRRAHIKYHLATADILAPAQARRYAELRGYARRGVQPHHNGSRP